MKRLIIIILSLLLLCSCKQSVEKNITESDIVANTKEETKETSTKSNASKEEVKEIKESKKVEYHNPSMVVTNEDYAYYCNWGHYIDDNGKFHGEGDVNAAAIIQYELKTGKKEIIANVAADDSSFILKDNFLFYTEDRVLHKINLLDRTCNDIIKNIKRDYYCTIDNKIVYINKEGKLLTANFDGEIENELLANEKIYLSQVKGNKIYFGDSSDSIYCINVDGSDNYKVLNNASRPIITDTTIYYVGEDGLYKANLDGSNPQYVVGDWNMFYFEAGDYIYYYDFEKEGIARIDIETGMIDDKIIHLGFIDMIQIGNFLYIRNMPMPGQYEYKKVNLETFEITDNTEMFF
ncbi:hypothetical protein [Vallitalea guaymasensis]|uniref:DUF5050 domain-containing protein n=1 Tax=Vallitalea guaymasensis TaxID=1185412 RepID=A0A8J8SCB3_9FIRM|nr:hypothetical protein [Vallitalea guaymasensis]QUH29246.1 hypothetical protein HYG85_10035 [Vallitalea guaymasensis]